MDALTSLIDEQRDTVRRLQALIDEYTRELEIAQAKLIAYEHAAELRPAEEGRTARRGRQPGAISREWRGVLRAIAFSSGPQTSEQIHSVALSHGITADISSVRDRIRAFQSAGYLLLVGPDLWAVTSIAAGRFGFEDFAGRDDADEIEEAF